MQAAAPGVLLLNPSLNPVAYNSEAVQILAFPNNPERLKRLPAFLASQIRSKLSARSSLVEGQQFVREFRSGSRTYRCSAVNLRSSKVGTGDEIIALLFERRPSTTSSLKRQIWKQFELTERQSQTVELLLLGMTTKEIAQSMNISSNTVKTYLRLIMAKMRVTTRAGIVGKILAP